MVISLPEQSAPTGIVCSSIHRQGSLLQGALQTELLRAWSLSFRCHKQAAVHPAAMFMPSMVQELLCNWCAVLSPLPELGLGVTLFRFSLTSAPSFGF